MIFSLQYLKLTSTVKPQNQSFLLQWERDPPITIIQLQSNKTLFTSHNLSIPNKYQEMVIYLFRKYRTLQLLHDIYLQASFTY